MSNCKVQHVLLLNGWSAPSALWDEFFSNGFESCSVEVLSLTKIHSLNEWSALIDSKIKPGTLLIGWSLGGELALNYLTNFQSDDNQKKQVVGAVLLQSTPCFVKNDSWQSGVPQEDFDSLLGLLRAPDLPGLIRRFSFLLVAGSQYRKLDKEFLESHYQVENLPDYDALKQSLELLRTVDIRAQVSSLDLPVVWLLGERDSLVAPDIEAFKSLLPESNSEIVQVIERMGHFPCGRHASDVKERIFQFMRGL